MEATVFIIVLVAAFFHATWNAFIKIDGNRVIFMALMLAFGGSAALISTVFLPLPHPESWPYIAISVLVHQGYLIFLLLSYRFGDLSHVYPLARGSAPLIVALLSITLIGEELSHHSLIAIALMGVGIMSLSFTRSAQNLRNPVAVFFALGTGLFIASYTLIDGVGARLAGNPHSYSAWMLGLEWIPFAVYVFLRQRRNLRPHLVKMWKPAALIGLLCLAAYWAVIWAMTVAPIALVAALRETSIVFVLVLGVVFLKERLSLVKLAATFTTLVGTILIKLGRT